MYLHTRLPQPFWNKSHTGGKCRRLSTVADWLYKKTHVDQSMFKENSSLHILMENFLMTFFTLKNVCLFWSATTNNGTSAQQNWQMTSFRVLFLTFLL